MTKDMSGVDVVGILTLIAAVAGWTWFWVWAVHKWFDK